MRKKCNAGEKNDTFIALQNQKVYIITRFPYLIVTLAINQSLENLKKKTYHDMLECLENIDIVELEKIMARVAVQDVIVLLQTII